MWAEIIATALGISTIWQTARAYRFQKVMAESQGAFSKPKVGLTCWGMSGVDTYLVAVPVSGGPIVIPLLLQAKNNGSATAKGLQLILRAHKSLFLFGDEEVRQLGNSARVVESSGELQSIFFELPSLHPGAATQIEVPVFFGEATQGKLSVGVVTADHHKLTANIAYTAAFRIDAVLFQENQLPDSLTCRVEVLDDIGRPPETVIDHYINQTLRPSSSTEGDGRLLFQKFVNAGLHIGVVAVTETKRTANGILVVPRAHDLEIYDCRTRYQFPSKPERKAPQRVRLDA